MDALKTCPTCKHDSLSFTAEPCKGCRLWALWEPNEKLEVVMDPPKRSLEIDLVEQPTVPASEMQVGGAHYITRGIQPIAYIFANKLGFCEGNVVKYVTRYQDKNGVEDLKKARHYLDMLIERLENDA